MLNHVAWRSHGPLIFTDFSYFALSSWAWSIASIPPQPVLPSFSPCSFRCLVASTLLLVLLFPLGLRVFPQSSLDSSLMATWVISHELFSAFSNIWSRALNVWVRTGLWTVHSETQSKGEVREWWIWSLFQKGELGLLVHELGVIVLIHWKKKKRIAEGTFRDQFYYHRVLSTFSQRLCLSLKMGVR